MLFRSLVEGEKVVGVIAESIDSSTIEIIETTEIVEMVEAIDEIEVEEPVEEAPDTTVVAMPEAPVGMSEHPSSEPAAQEHIAEVVQLFGKKRKEAEPPQVVVEPSVEVANVVEVADSKKLPSATTPQKKSVDDLFARLKQDRKSTRLNSSHIPLSRMPSSA